MNAVKLFQATHRDQEGQPLEVDGKIGSLTWYAMFGPDTVPVIDAAASNLLNEALKVAQSQIGVMEDPPGSNSGAKVEAYQASVGIGAGTYWCAAFVYWCFQQACNTLGRRNPVLQTGHCMTHWNRTPGKKIAALDAEKQTFAFKTRANFYH